MELNQDCSPSKGAIFNEPTANSGGPVTVVCSVVEACINAKLNDVRPKCLTSQSNWNTMSITQKMQLIIDRLCQGQPPSITFGNIPVTDITAAPLNIPVTIHVDPGKTLSGQSAVQISGPSALNYALIPAGSPAVDYYNFTLRVSGFSTALQAGTYTVRITAVDSATLTSTVNIPFTLKYTDFSLSPDSKSITSPVSSTTLSPAVVQGSFPLSYVWTFVSGPLAPTIVSPTQRTTQVTGLTSAGTYILRLTGNEVGGTATHSVDSNIVVTGGVTYDTVATFATNPSTTVEGVNLQATGINNLLKFEFNKVANPTGLYSTFIISVNGTQTLQVTFRTEYTDLPYRFTSTSGVTHNGVFRTTDINFTE